MQYSAAIFDLDGTLVDSNSIWEKIDRIFLNRRGITVSDDFFIKLTSMAYEEAADEMHKIGISETLEEITYELNEMAAYEYEHNIMLKNGVVEYLSFLKENKIKAAIATASPQIFYEAVLKNNGVYDLFDAFATTDEVEIGKDSPAVYLLAADKLSVAPEDCVVFEDVAKGLKSAGSVGFKTIAVYDRYSENNEDEIRKYSCKFIYNFAEML